jgi:WxL domain surface cell wall-binding
MRHKLLILGALCLAVLTVTAAAAASTLTPTATITGAGGVSMSLPGDPSFSDTLNGTDQTVQYSAVLGITDARGNGAGWNLTISSTTFSDGASHTLAPGAVSAVAAVCVGGSSCTAATNAIGYPLTVTGTATKFYNAATSTGMGKVNVTPTVDVTIPGNAFAGTYTSTVTLAAVSGP